MVFYRGNVVFISVCVDGLLRLFVWLVLWFFVLVILFRLMLNLVSNMVSIRLIKLFSKDGNFIL